MKFIHKVYVLTLIAFAIAACGFLFSSVSIVHAQEPFLGFDYDGTDPTDGGYALSAIFESVVIDIDDDELITGISFLAARTNDNDEMLFQWAVRNSNNEVIDCVTEIADLESFGFPFVPFANRTELSFYEWVYVPLNGESCNNVSDWGSLVKILGPSATAGNPVPLVAGYSAKNPVIAYKLYVGSDVPVTPSYFSRVISSSPPDLSAIDSTTVNWSFTIQSAQNVTGKPLSEACIQYVGWSDLQNNVPICFDVLQSGQITFSTTTAGLVADSSYYYKIVLYDTDGTAVYSTADINFYTGDVFPENYIFVSGGGGQSTTTPIADITAECDPSDPFFERSICNIAMLLFSPSSFSFELFQREYAKMQTKFPFAYVYSFKNTIDSISFNEVSTEPPSLNMVYWAGSEPVDLFDEEVVSRFYPDTARNFMRNLILVFVWVMAGVVVWRMRTQIFQR